MRNQHSSQSQGRSSSLVWLVVCSLLMGLASNGLTAPRSRSASSYARQARQRAIDAVRKEIAAAKQILEQLQSKQSLSQSQLQEAASQLSARRKDADAAEHDDAEIHRKLREIEERVLSNQGPESEYGRQAEIVEASRKSLDAELHRVTGLEPHPADADMESERVKELAGLSEDQRGRLNADERYKAARDDLQKQRRKLETVEQQVLAADPEWKRTVEDHERAEKEEDKAQTAQRSSARDSNRAMAQVRSQQELASRAQAVIANGEAKLRQLGVQP
jgi:chromosome segregation ATPase